MPQRANKFLSVGAILLAALLLTDSAASKTTHVCEPQAITMKFVSLKRTQPGTLVLTVELENAANVGYRFAEPTMGKSTQLIDDQGDTWTLQGYGGSVYNGKNLLAGGKIKLNYTFLKSVGGNDAKLASLTGQLGIYPSQKTGYAGKCILELRDLPIE